jgi:uroporphyrinogen-III synthase
MSALAGKRVLVTRASHQAEELARPLRERGALPVLLPTIAIVPPVDDAPLRAAAKNVAAYDWIIFNSVNAVEAFTACLDTDPRLVHAKVAAVGDVTRRRATNLGWTVTVVPQSFTSEALTKTLADEPVEGSRFLIPASAETRTKAREVLQARGAVVDVIEAYRSGIPEETPARAAELFSKTPSPDWATFTSPLTFEHLVRLVGTPPLREMKLAVIGSVTGSAVRAAGLTVHAEPAEHTISSMIEAMCRYCVPPPQ